MTIRSLGGAGSGLGLTSGAIECAPLGLNDAMDFGFSTGGTRFSFASVDSVVKLVASLSVESISERTIREGGPFRDDGLSENFAHGVINPEPSGSGDL
jgi:hypothetical protein